MKRRRIRRPGRSGVVNHKDFSIVITCYNYGRFLDESVNSVLRQIGVDVEVIIVDDASTDDSADVAAAFAAMDTRVSVVRLTKNVGPARAFNEGLARCGGTYTVRLDADDLLTPGCLARAGALLERFPNVSFAYGHPVHFETAAPPDRARSRVRSWTLWPGEEWLRLRCMRGTSCITSPEVVMRTRAVKRAGGMRDLAHSHDFELWMRLAAWGDVGHIEGADQAYHREHAASLTATRVDSIRDLEERRDAFNALFTDDLEINGARGSAPLLRTMAMRTLAAESLTEAIRILDRGNSDYHAVERYVEFADCALPTAQALREWCLLERRFRLGPLTAVTGLGLAGRSRRRARALWAELRWKRFGV